MLLRVALCVATQLHSYAAPSPTLADPDLPPHLDGAALLIFTRFGGQDEL